MKILNKMQRRAAIWILGAFKISPSEGIEAIAGIISIKFHLQKLAERSLIHLFKLPANHIIRDLMDDLLHQNKGPNTHAVGSHPFPLFTRNLLLAFIYQTLFLITFLLT